MSAEEGLLAVEARIAAACARAGRPRGEVTLHAVSKRHGPSAIRAAYAGGQRDFAENYVQELVEKAEALADLDELRWHFVGHLQRNKVKAVLEVGASVSTVDSPRLIDALDSRAASLGVCVPVLLQVNVGDEASKSGCAVAELDALVEHARAAGSLALRGLMTIPPHTDDPEGARPYFATLRDLAAAHGLAELSMGMSADLEVAIEEGATIVRIGIAIFGART